MGKVIDIKPSAVSRLDSLQWFPLQIEGHTKCFFLYRPCHLLDQMKCYSIFYQPWKAQNNIINIGGVINLQMGHVYNETPFVGTSNDPPPPCSFHFDKICRSVEIDFTYCSHQKDFDSLIKCSVETFLHPYAQNLKDLRMRHSWLLFHCKILWYGISWNLSLRIALDKWRNEVTRWCRECDHVTFPGTSYNVCNFLVEVSTFKQAIKGWLLDVTNSAKRQYKIYRPQYIFRKSRVFKLIKSMTNFIYQKSNSM